MKINIIHNFTESPFGGGNTFLRTLRNEFIKLGLYTDSYSESNIVLYNGHQECNTVQNYFQEDSADKLFFHRLDGLQKLYNHPDDPRQDLAIFANRFANGGTIYQSQWAYDEFKKCGILKVNNYLEDDSYEPTHTIIYNASDPEIFYKPNKYIKNNKTKLVCTSWSPNVKKGFLYYQFLDKNLNFDSYEFHFVGNKPDNVKFNNIICHSPKNTKEIGDFLRECDVFITGAENECCSNSLIEALTIGLPVVALDSGSNPELVTENNGEVFEDEYDLMTKISKVSIDLKKYRKSINTLTMKECVNMYIEFFRHSLEQHNR